MKTKTLYIIIAALLIGIIVQSMRVADLRSTLGIAIEREAKLCEAQAAIE